MWRRFGQYRQDRRALKKGKTLSQSAIFAIVEQELRIDISIPKERWRKHSDFSYLKPLIDAAKERIRLAENSEDHDAIAAAWLRSLILQAPHAAQAQVQMDKHKHSFRNKAARVLELIDFNDAYVSTVLAMPDDHLHMFNAELKLLVDWFCKRVGAWTFSDEQFDAIAHGLSREIAVYNAVQKAGFDVRMTTRAEDAFGIDMRITDRVTRRMVNIDTKTSSAFHYRLIDLLREGRLSTADIDLAERRGFVAVFNGHGDQKVRVILWRIDHGTLGDITDFAFKQTDTLIEELGEILKEYGEIEEEIWTN